jgi:hypothetical protein
LLESAVNEVGDFAGGDPAAVWGGGGGDWRGLRSQPEPGGRGGVSCVVIPRAVVPGVGLPT